MNRMKFYAGLDFGGTSGRMRLADEQGQVIGTYIGEGCSLNTDGMEKGGQRYRALIENALQKEGLRAQDCLGLCAAASGADSPEYVEGCRQILVDLGFPRERVIVVNDCEIFLYDLPVPALVLVAGTGSICFGRDREGNVVRTGGWNHILSDEGSGFDLGLQVCRQVGDYLDGRTRDGVLYELFHEQTGISDLMALNDFVNDYLFEKDRIGQMAMLLEPALDQKSVDAERILGNAAGRLKELVEDTYRKIANGGGSITIMFWGSVLMKNKRIQEWLSQEILKVIPECEIVLAQKEAVDIAVDAARSWNNEK